VLQLKISSRVELPSTLLTLMLSTKIQRLVHVLMHRPKYVTLISTAFRPIRCSRRLDSLTHSTKLITRTIVLVFSAATVSSRLVAAFVEACPKYFLRDPWPTRARNARSGYYPTPTYLLKLLTTFRGCLLLPARE
jgi:hypothetical protein